MGVGAPKHTVHTDLSTGDSEPENGMLSRRTMVGRLAVGTAAVLTAGLAKSSSASVEADKPKASELGQMRQDPNPQVVDAGTPATATAAAPWELLHPLRQGAELADGWRLAELSGVVDGSCVVTVRNERGRAYRIHLCRNDGAPQGLVHTQKFDLVVMNGGQGDLPTEEAFAQAVASLAHVLAANEGDWQKQPLASALLPHGERLRLFSGPVDRRLR